MTVLSTAKLFSGLFLVAGLAACGSSSEEDVTFASLDEERDEILTDLAAASPTLDMPTSGTAYYEGVAGFKVGSAASSVADMDFLADAALAADFGAGEIEGDFYDFHDTSGNSLTGNFKVEDGVITDNTFSADVNGSYVQDGVVATLEGTTTGTFLGDDAELISGDVTGTVSYVDGSTADMFGDVSMREDD
ncbi:transferrin-binding protein-like solute binding protein [Pseudooceanicola sp. C21-150M6]|uniref:transferrin-binding protein-like solute binding protein n=1 Tax=Pseudooceanicola sp. C21-150M6 TaxID=3434355 RepID=UPI003D7FF28B